jgi:hypothetical protein
MTICGARRPPAMFPVVLLLAVETLESNILYLVPYLLADDTPQQQSSN